jgi:peroxiredoxin
MRNIDIFVSLKIKSENELIMNRKILIVFLLFAGALSAQNYTIQGTIEGLEAKKITLSDFYGNENRVVDSVFSNEKGSFSYAFPDNFHTGMYRLRFGDNQYIDIIFNHENIQFETHLSALIDSLVFESSRENQLYFEYLNRRNMMEYKLELLGPVVTYYPQDDPFYNKAEDRFSEIIGQFDEFVGKLIDDHPGTYVSRVVKMDHTPSPPREQDQIGAMMYMREHFFDNMDFSDTTLLYSNVISGKVIQYLSFYQNNRMSKDQLQVEFIKAVNKIMDVTRVNPLVYEYVLDYLIGGFESYGFDRVITYIADNVNLDETCVNSERKAELEKKVESLKKFAVGNKAPDFTAYDLEGNEITLSALNSEYTVLVFWATWCPHCTTLLPELQQIYFPEQRDKLEIVAVSLDESPEELKKFLATGDYQWVNISDYKKWKGDVVQQYDIYATPTMFLLFSDRTILAKPMTYDELKNELFERNILH